MRGALLWSHYFFFKTTEVHFKVFHCLSASSSSRTLRLRQFHNNITSLYLTAVFSFRICKFPRLSKPSHKPDSVCEPIYLLYVHIQRNELWFSLLQIPSAQSRRQQFPQCHFFLPVSYTHLDVYKRQSLTA